MEKAIFEILAKVDAMGGTVRAVEQGWFQREIADSAYATERRKAAGEHPVIGINRFVEEAERTPLEIHRIDPQTESRQIVRLKAARAGRDQVRVDQLLDRLEKEARDPAANLMPTTIELVKARASLGEIVKRLRVVFGAYVEAPVF